jgi:hypothetical protein
VLALSGCYRAQATGPAGETESDSETTEDTDTASQVDTETTEDTDTASQIDTEDDTGDTDSSGCCPGEITITSASELAAMADCTCLDGSLTVTADDLIGLDLPNLELIQGGLTVLSCPNVVDLSGLSSLHTVETELFVKNNDSLTTIGTPALESAEAVIVVFNDALTDVDGLEGITSLEGNLCVGQAPALQDLGGLTNIIEVGGYCDISYSQSLPTLDGLESLTSVGDDLRVRHLAGVTDLAPLSGVSYVGADLEVEYNDSLETLTGLHNIEDVGAWVRISGNPELTDISALEWLGPSVLFISITGNDALESLTALSGVEEIEGSLSITSNDSLESLVGLEGITTIDGNINVSWNPVLGDLDGLVSLSSLGGSATISHNPSMPTCEVCELFMQLDSWPYTWSTLSNLLDECAPVTYENCL